MTAREITTQSEWDACLSLISPSPLLQSWGWGEMQRALGKRVERLIIEEDGHTLFAVQMHEERRSRGSYWFAASGPVPLRGELPAHAWRECITLLKERYMHGRTLFLRVEPWTRSLPESVLNEQPHGHNPPIHWMVSLKTSTEEELLAGMHQKTRYNIRLGERQDVQVRTSVTHEDMEAFLKLMHETAARDEFQAHNDAYLRASFHELARLGMAQLRIAEHNGEALAMSFEVAFGDTVTYLHGASTAKSREIKAPNVLHWHAMRDARNCGYAWYDFGGCNPADAQSPLYKSSLDGVTRFKEGWGGGRIEFAGTFDIWRWSWLAWLKRT